MKKFFVIFLVIFMTYGPSVLAGDWDYFRKGGLSTGVNGSTEHIMDAVRQKTGTSPHFNCSVDVFIMSLAETIDTLNKIHDWGFKSFPTPENVLWILLNSDIVEASWKESDNITLARLHKVTGEVGWRKRDSRPGEYVFEFEGVFIVSSSCYNPIRDFRNASVEAQVETVVVTETITETVIAEPVKNVPVEPNVEPAPDLVVTHTEPVVTQKPVETIIREVIKESECKGCTVIVNNNYTFPEQTAQSSTQKAETKEYTQQPVVQKRKPARYYTYSPYCNSHNGYHRGTCSSGLISYSVGRGYYYGLGYYRSSPFCNDCRVNHGRACGYGGIYYDALHGYYYGSRYSTFNNNYFAGYGRVNSYYRPRGILNESYGNHGNNHHVHRGPRGTLNESYGNYGHSHGGTRNFYGGHRLMYGR